MANLADEADRLRLDIEAVLRAYPDLAGDETLRLDTLEGATDSKEFLAELADRLADTIAMQVGIKSRIDELRGRAERFAERELFFRELMFKVMDTASLRKIELTEATLSLRNNPPSLIGEADPATLPDDLVKVTRTINRKAVREALESGHRVEGFTLSNSLPSLVVRVK